MLSWLFRGIYFARDWTMSTGVSCEAVSLGVDIISLIYWISLHRDYKLVLESLLLSQRFRNVKTVQPQLSCRLFSGLAIGYSAILIDSESSIQTEVREFCCQIGASVSFQLISARTILLATKVLQKLMIEYAPSDFVEAKIWSIAGKRAHCD